MLASSIPVKLPIPFAYAAGGGYIRPIPLATQISVNPGFASLTDGFVPLNAQPVASGGIPPFIQDLNGILYETSAWAWWQAAGGPVFYDSDFQTSIGGYPRGALVQSAVTTGVYWRSTVDNNTTNPDAAGAGWRSLFAVGDFSAGIDSVSQLLSVNNPNGTAAAFQNRLNVANAPATFFRSDRTDGYFAQFLYQGALKGWISTDGTSVSFISISDYRDKQDIRPLTSALDRMSKVRAKRFKHLGSDVEVDGFLAHEYAVALPEGVTGEKDGEATIGDLTAADGSVAAVGVQKPDTVPEGLKWKKTGKAPIYQGIDKAKAVPLMWNAILELQDMVAALQAQVAALTPSGSAAPASPPPRG